MKYLVWALMLVGLAWFAVETAPMAAFWLVVSILLTWFILDTGFLALMNARRVIKSGDSIHWFFLLPLYPLLAIAWPADVIFNVFGGTFIFKEWPREFTFTSRCKRHKEASFGQKYARAVWWCDEMNKFAKGHC